MTNLRWKFALIGIAAVAYSSAAMADPPLAQLDSHYVGESKEDNAIWKKRSQSENAPCDQKNWGNAANKSCVVEYFTKDSDNIEKYSLFWDEKKEIWETYDPKDYKDKKSKGLKGYKIIPYDTFAVRLAVDPKYPARSPSDLATWQYFGVLPAIWVMDKDFKLYVFPAPINGKYHHSSILAGGDVVAAGLLVAKEGRITAISNQSGHYKPNTDQFAAALKHIKGYDPNGVWCTVKTESTPNPVCKKFIPNRDDKEIISSLEKIKKNTPAESAPPPYTGDTSTFKKAENQDTQEKNEDENLDQN